MIHPVKLSCFLDSSLFGLASHQGEKIIIASWTFCVCEQHHMTSLAWAAGRGHAEIVQMLISKGAKVNTADKVSVILFVCVFMSVHVCVSEGGGWGWGGGEQQSGVRERLFRY